MSRRTSTPCALLAPVLCCLLLLAGAALALASGTEALWLHGADPVVFVALFTVLYCAAQQYSVDFELRRECHSVTLVQVPLALGVMYVAPPAHLAARLLAPLLLGLWQRQAPLKALFNIASAAFEVGAASFAVHLVDPAPGPALWVALYVGLLVGDVVGTLTLSAVWWLVGMPVTQRTAVRALAVVMPVTLVFTTLSIVTLSAVRDQPAVWVVLLVLAGMLSLAYRTHRRVVGQQQATQALYDFVKDLGPLDLGSRAAELTLERMRLLLHAERLDLALLQAGTWCHLVARDGQEPLRSATVPAGGPVTQLPVRGPALGGRGGSGDDTMVTPLLAMTELAGVLTATGRLGAARRFDMGDLRLLETVGAELATALDRGRLLTDLERSATTDALTGLPNLEETTRRLDAQLDQEHDVVLIALNVLSFRAVNDALGRELGDELLLEVSRRLVAACPEAVVGRVGGARVAVGLPARDVGPDPEHFGLSLRALVEGPAQLGALGTPVRLSVGLVRAPDHGTSASTLLRRAETAMYGGRHVGGGPVLWEPAYEVLGNRRLAVAMALREALSSCALAVVYQPKVSVASGDVTGVEALARWSHPALGVVGPEEFVPLAEASGLMGPLTATVLSESLQACQQWQHSAHDVGVSVNVSAETVLDAGFTAQVAQALSDSGLPARLLTLELTETVLLRDPVLAATRMAGLRALGVRLAVDDFGTGYSSLTYLRELPVDEVKVDKAFVDGIADDAADQAVVRAVVDIAHTLGLRVVAEGVQAEDQMLALRVLEVDEAQGFLHARPMPSAQLEPWLRQRRTSRHS